MRYGWLGGKCVLVVCLALGCAAGVGRAGDPTDGSNVIAPQQKQVQAPGPKDGGPVTLDDDLIKKITADYLRQNAGLSPGMCFDHSSATGAGIPSSSNPSPWYAEKTPFEMRIRGEMQLLLWTIR
jgi:hypothetical protein